MRGVRRITSDVRARRDKTPRIMSKDKRAKFVTRHPKTWHEEGGKTFLIVQSTLYILSFLKGEHA